MPTVTVTGTVTDQSGASGNYSVDITLYSPITLTAFVVPVAAIAGTTRTLTVTPAGGAPPFIFSPPVSAGLTFVPVEPGKWTFVL